MFRRPKKENNEVVEKPIKKCSFCRKSNAVGNLGIVYYCTSNSCATKLWNKQKKQDAIELERKKQMKSYN